MFQDLISCRIFSFNEEEYNKLLGAYDRLSVSIVKGEYFSDDKIPSLIIGWENVQKLFPEQNISEKQIGENLFWTFSYAENKEDYNKDTKVFVNNSFDDFFNLRFLSYDYIMDGELKNFISENINQDKKYYIHFYKNACYLFDGEKNIVLGLESIDASGKNSRDIITQLINKLDCILYSYDNVSEYVDMDSIGQKLTLENIYWTKFSYLIETEEFQAAYRGVEIGRYLSYLNFILSQCNIDLEEHTSCIRQAVRDVITCWLSSRAVFFSSNFKPGNNIKVRWHNYRKYTKPKYSNKRTRTGRINCVTDSSTSGFNPQMLPKDSPIRKDIISRHKNGKIVVFDYIAFEPKLSLYYSKDEDFINRFQNSDLHVEIAKVIYQRESVGEKERTIGKRINNTIINGGGDKIILDTLKNIPDREKALDRIKELLKPILDTSEYVNGICKEFGCITNDFGTILRPTKIYAAYNNFIQSTASEIMVDKLYEIKDFIAGTNINFLFQIHDSFIFDFGPGELDKIEQIQQLLSNYKGFHFPISYRIGDSYQDCK